MSPRTAPAAPQASFALPSDPQLQGASVPQAPAAVQTDGRWAVLVGIDVAAGSRRLAGAVRDATTLRDALSAYGFPSGQVITLLDRAAGRAAILDAVDRLARFSPPEGRAVFAFAGHTRRIGGQNHLVAADGSTIPASLLAERLARVRAPMWLVFPTCYAAGFDVPGIIGPGRVATWASAANQLAYEASWFGRSFLVQYLVQQAMLEGRAPGSVEEAFAYARAALERDYPNRVPLMDDRYEGNFVLGDPSRLPRPPLPMPGPAAPAGPAGAPPPTPQPAPPAPSPPPPNSGMTIEIPVTCGLLEGCSRPG